MRLTKKQIDLLNRRKTVILATAGLNNEPRAIPVEVNRAESDKIIITDNEMRKTRRNLLKNKKVFIVAFEKDYSVCLKIKGMADYSTKGKYFEFVKSLEANKSYAPKAAVVVNIKDITELK